MQLTTWLLIYLISLNLQVANGLLGPGVAADPNVALTPIESQGSQAQEGQSHEGQAQGGQAQEGQESTEDPSAEGVEDLRVLLVEALGEEPVAAIVTEVGRGQVAGNLWVLANKEQPLGKAFVPKDIVHAAVKQKYGNTTVSRALNEALVALFEAAKADGIELVLSSGYRDYGFQASLYQQQVKKVGAKEANRWVAKPGESEHQTGLAVDITAESVGLKLTQDFEQTEEFEWLKQHAPDYGFILRYPQDKESETGYSYEPWHWRYLGHPEAARFIHDKTITLEAFMTALAARK